jgi:hypothetical protein
MNETKVIDFNRNIVTHQQTVQYCIISTIDAREK